MLPRFPSVCSGPSGGVLLRGMQLLLESDFLYVLQDEKLRSFKLFTCRVFSASSVFFLGTNVVYVAKKPCSHSFQLGPRRVPVRFEHRLLYVDKAETHKGRLLFDLNIVSIKVIQNEMRPGILILQQEGWTSET